MVLKTLLGLFVAAMLFTVGWVIGAEKTRRSIASAIRLGRLSLNQRVDSVAEQIEADVYMGTEPPWVAKLGQD